MKSYRHLTLIFIAILSYFLSHFNRNDVILAPWNVTWVVCRFANINCYNTLQKFAKFAEENINWEVERETYYRMMKGEIYQLQEIDSTKYSYQKLNEMTKGFTIPAVVRGLFRGSPAVNKWASPQYFIDNYGDDELIVLENGGVIDAEKFAENTMSVELAAAGSLENANKKGKEKRCHVGYSAIQQAKVMKLRDAVSGMMNGKKYYLSNVDTIFRKHNDLLNETLLVERLSPWAYADYKPSAVQIFMGFGSNDRTKATGTSIHCASGTNAFYQVVGCKAWEFVPSRYALFLNPQVSSKFPAAVGLAFPEWVPRYNTTICAGDLLLNPAWMWHRIFNQEGFNIGLATRENHPLWQIRNAPGFTLMQEVSGDNKVARDAIDWLMPNETKEQKDRVKLFMSIPLLAFSISYFKELFMGVQPHPFLDAWTNTCDEHDPRCAASFYDRMVYSYDECIKEE